MCGQGLTGQTQPAGDRLQIGTVVPIPVAMAGYCAYVYTIVGDPLCWLTAQKYLGYSLGHLPWQQLQRMIGSLLDHGPYDYFFISDIAPVRTRRSS